MRKTGLVYHDDYLLHDTGVYHPERPARLKRIIDKLHTSGQWDQLQLIMPKPADVKWIGMVHSNEYINFVQRECGATVAQLDADTAICKDSFRIALLAVGGCLGAADAIMKGEVINAFCAVRPPGHHAEKSRAMGFCLFNNVAITAKYIQQNYGLEKILIIDWDVHHGNGTQHAFYEDASVFYFSTHQSPHYPGTGLSYETGKGKGEGFNLNVPLPAGSGDKEYAEVFHDKLIPAAEKFKPDFILISAGFDAHRDDPLAGMLMTEAGFAHLTEMVTDLAEKFCAGKIISVLEGGYHLEKLAVSVAAHIDILQKGCGHEKSD